MDLKEVNCLRCGNKMKYLMTEKIQLGQTGWILGDLPNLVAGSLEADIYTCPQCGKIELFQSSEYTDVDDENTSSQIAQKKCPNCGNSHDIDYPKCPFCKFDYNE